VIGRPATPEAVAEAKQLLSGEDKHDPPSVRLNIDVQQIMRQQVSPQSPKSEKTHLIIISLPPLQILNMAATSANPPPKPILDRTATPPPPNQRVSFSGQNHIIPIMSDNIGRQLRQVTNGIPNSPIRQQQQQ